MEQRLLHFANETPAIATEAQAEQREASEKPSEACAAAMTSSVEIAQQYPEANAKDAAEVAKKILAQEEAQ
jgi:hypothetical protein